MGDFVEDSQMEEADGSEDESVKVATVVCVRVGKISWLPETMQVQSHTFVKLSKWDRGVCKIILGRGMYRHKARGEAAGKARADINVQAWHDVAKLRREACDQKLREKFEEVEASLEDQVQQPPQKIRAAQQDDQYLVSRFIDFSLPAVETERGRRYEETQIKALWQVKGLDLWMELDEKHLEHFFALLRHSPPPVITPAPKRSPKRRKRTLKRRASETPGDGEAGEETEVPAS